MAEGSFAQGFMDGWQSVAGEAPMPNIPSLAPPDDKSAFQYGFECGRAEALMRFTPGSAPREA
jgi:hypothetical protein